ncbi:MAG: GNAT family N-acetyltransferase [Gammaproteobacteria bacterium]
MTPPATIRPAIAADAASCAAIYAHYVLHTACTFEDAPPPAAEFAARINNAKLFLSAEDAGGEVCGYAYADVWRTRCGYRFVVETSVYVDAAKAGRGTGKMLMAALLAQLAKTPTRSAVATIALPNPASIALHEKLGFAACGKLPGIGWKFDSSHDVGFWLYDFDTQPGR